MILSALGCTSFLTQCDEVFDNEQAVSQHVKHEYPAEAADDLMSACGIRAKHLGTLAI